MNERIFLSPPHMCGLEQQLVTDVFAVNYIAPVGPHITRFEQEMEERMGRPCVALTSGTAALHLALIITGVEAGHTVLCSDFTFIASVNPILYQQATPILVDAHKSDWNMDPALVRTYLEQTERVLHPTALVVTDLYGQPARLQELTDLCRQYNITLIEDAAEALGATFNKQPAGTFGRFGALSFNGNKIITTSGGGMLVCEHAEDAALARKLATQAREDAPHYEHTMTGFNYRMSNVCAAIGIGQLSVLDERVAARRRIFSWYQERLADIPGIGFMPEAPGCNANRWLTCVTFGNTSSGPDQAQGYAQREAVRLALEAEQIESRPLWNPMHRQPIFADAQCLGGETGADLFARGLCLPSGTALTPQQVDRICTCLRRAL